MLENATIKREEDRLAEYIVRLQTRSTEHPELDGAFFRAWDFSKWEVWASGNLFSLSPPHTPSRTHSLSSSSLTSWSCVACCCGVLATRRCRHRLVRKSFVVLAHLSFVVSVCCWIL